MVFSVKNQTKQVAFSVKNQTGSFRLKNFQLHKLNFLITLQNKILFLHNETVLKNLVFITVILLIINILNVNFSIFQNGKLKKKGYE